MAEVSEKAAPSEALSKIQLGGHSSPPKGHDSGAREKWTDSIQVQARGPDVSSFL